MTVIQFFNKCMKDPETRAGGFMKNERKYLDEIGFKYTVENGQITDYGKDLHEFYEAFYTILRLNDKYNKTTGREAAT